MIEIFKTNIKEASDTNVIIQKLLEHLQLSKIDFDLEDCDKILRIESKFIDIPKVIQLLNENEFQCEILV
jgi:hypothetical protein